ncbi:MAG: hypothetical protein LBQ12_09905, partial [Deltaproteobacteria bacterium]|nr:hypothetical protein [Deltaproteobacteria bacterium]
NECTVDGLFGVKAKLELAGVTQPLADALASPSKFPGAEYRYLKRLADAPEFLNAGIRGWELDFADVSLMERLSRGPGQSEREPADMAAPFEALFEEPADMAAAFEAIFEEFAYLIESVLRLPVNPAFREASAAWSAAPGSFKIAFRPASTATASEIIETFGKGRRDPEGFRKLLQIVVSVEGGPEIPLLEKGSKLMQGPQRSRLSY